MLGQTSTKFCSMYTYHGMTDETEVKIELEEMIKDDVVLFDKYAFPSPVINGAILFHSTKVMYAAICAVNVIQSECGKIEAKKNSVFGDFSHSVCSHILKRSLRENFIFSVTARETQNSF